MLKGKNYEITAKNIFAHEMIGLQASVFGSSDKSRRQISGIVVDETKNVFSIETQNGVKKTPKKESVFEFTLGEKKVIVDGKKICFRPQDRIKVFWGVCR